jgi:hypothetical protein
MHTAESGQNDDGTGIAVRCELLFYCHHKGRTKAVKEPSPRHPILPSRSLTTHRAANEYEAKFIESPLITASSLLWIVPLTLAAAVDADPAIADCIEALTLRNQLRLGPSTAGGLPPGPVRLTIGEGITSAARLSQQSNDHARPNGSRVQRSNERLTPSRPLPLSRIRFPAETKRFPLPLPRCETIPAAHG